MRGRKIKKIESSLKRMYICSTVDIPKLDEIMEEGKNMEFEEMRP